MGYMNVFEITRLGYAMRQWLAENSAKFTRGVLYEKKFFFCFFLFLLDVSKDNWCCNSLSNIKNEFTIHIFSV